MRRSTKSTTGTALATAGLLLLSACSGTSETLAPGAGALTTTTSAATTSTSEATTTLPASTTTSAGPDVDSSGGISINIGPISEQQLKAGNISSPALGGIKFTIADTHLIFADQNFIGIASSEPFDVYPAAVVLALINERAASLGPVVDVADFLSIIEKHNTVTKLAETIETLGYTLQGYQISDGSVDWPDFEGVTGAPPGGFSDTYWLPGPEGVIFLADTPEGVLAIDYEAENLEGLPAAKSMFDQIVPTLEWDS